MSSDDQRAEAARLQSEINSLISRINSVNRENSMLESEIRSAIINVQNLIEKARVMGGKVNRKLSDLEGRVDNTDITTKELNHALHELTSQYFLFKNMSTASKNVSQLRDEYYTRFASYHNLRRIVLGFVIGLDTNIISSETLRKEVEKSYLSNTDYWLAYAGASVMLWASDEKDAAKRALDKSISMQRFNSYLFYLLINLRFNRLDTAKQWYILYLEEVNTQNLGEDWKWLLQAYLSGAFGTDLDFQQMVGSSIADQLSQVQVTTVDYPGRVSGRAKSFAQHFPHKTSKEYPALSFHCKEHSQMMELLSQAEKNSLMARYYSDLYQEERDVEESLPQRIENVLYSLVNSYDIQEYEVVKQIQFNEAILSARGDIAVAQKYIADQSPESESRNLGNLLIQWAFLDVEKGVNNTVKRFSISYLREMIAQGFNDFAEEYRTKEQDSYTFEIDEYTVTASEESYDVSKRKLEAQYDKNRVKDTVKDKQLKIYSLVVLGALAMLVLNVFVFSPVFLSVAIIGLLAGSFLLWRRIVDVGKILTQRKNEGVAKLRKSVDELASWRQLYKKEDSANQQLLEIINSFER